MPATILPKCMLARRTDGLRILFQCSLVIASSIFPVGLVDVFAANGNAAEPPEREVPDVVVLAEMPLPDQTPEAAIKPLRPRMRAALEHVSKRYRVSAVALGPVFEATELIGRERGLDPLLIVAIIAIESRFNPYAESPMGAQGLMQVIPRFHPEKLPKEAGHSLFNPVTNIHVGAQVLQEAIRRHGGLIAGLQRYGGAVNDVEQAYATKVLAEKRRLEEATLRNGKASA